MTLPRTQIMDPNYSFSRIRIPVVPAGILFAFILFPGFVPIRLASPLINLLGFAVMLFAFFRFEREFLRIVMPLLIIFLLGGVSALGHLPEDILRDISYALNPIMLLFIGYWLADSLKTWSLLAGIFVLCGLVFAGHHLLQFALNPMILSYDLDEIRKEAGAGDALEVLAFVLLIFQKSFGQNRVFQRYIPRLVAIGFLGISIILSFSRTNIVVLIILTLAIFDTMYRVALKKIFLSFVLISGVIAFFVFFPYQEYGSLITKIGGSLSEISISDKEDINTNWRGFEAHMAVEQFMATNIIQKILGQGFGALVDIEFYMPLGDSELRFIPILHNGYAYILTKVGLLGVLLYLIFFLRLLRYGFENRFSSSQLNRFYARLLVGCTLSQVVVMVVGGGMAQAAGTGPSFVIFIGYLSHRIGDFRIRREQASDSCVLE